MSIKKKRDRRDEFREDKLKGTIEELNEEGDLEGLKKIALELIDGTYDEPELNLVIRGEEYALIKYMEDIVKITDLDKELTRIQEKEKDGGVHLLEDYVNKKEQSRRQAAADKKEIIYTEEDIFEEIYKMGQKSAATVENSDKLVCIEKGHDIFDYVKNIGLIIKAEEKSFGPCYKVRTVISPGAYELIKGIPDVEELKRNGIVMIRAHANTLFHIFRAFGTYNAIKRFNTELEAKVRKTAGYTS